MQDGKGRHRNHGGADVSNEREPDREELAYESNWYRVLKALSRGEAVELGEAPDREIAILTGDPEAERPPPVHLSN
jgi:hypothetical protein